MKKSEMIAVVSEVLKKEIEEDYFTLSQKILDAIEFFGMLPPEYRQFQSNDHEVYLGDGRFGAISFRMVNAWEPEESKDIKRMYPCDKKALTK